MLLISTATYGFGSLDLEIKDFMSPSNVIQLGFEPNRIDLIVDVQGIDFEKCFQRKSEREHEGLKFNFLSLEDLIDAKKKAGRLRDLADVEELEKINLKKENKKK